MNDENVTEECQRISALPVLCINLNMRKATRVVSAFYDEALSPTGLHANQMMLLIPPFLMGPTSINVMAEKSGLDRTTLVRNLKPLEDRGLLTVKPGEDLRMRLVTLTSEGERVLKAALPLWEEAQKQVIEKLGSQYATFMETLGVLNDLPHTHMSES